MRALIVINPVARDGEFADVGDTIHRGLSDAGWTAAVSVPTGADDARAQITAACAEGVDAVIVAGGDGTVGIAVQALAGTEVVLGVVPVGTGNDFAAAFGLHVLDVPAAIGTVLSGGVRTIDLAVVTDDAGASRHVATVLATGFDSLVNDRANRLRWPRGRARYTIAIFIEYLRLRRVSYRVRWTDAEGGQGVVEEPLLMASVANTRSYGGGIPIAPQADPADGLLDLILVRPAGRLRLLRLLARVFEAQHENEPEVRIRRVTTARIEAVGVSAYADGDAAAVLPVTVSVARAALRVFAGT